MKTRDQVVARIEELHSELKKHKATRAASVRKSGARRSNLLSRPIRTVEGELYILEWVLEDDQDSN